MQSRIVGNTHVVAGGPEMLPGVLALLNENGIRTIGNPDLYVKAHKQFGIDEARELRSRASLKPLGERRVFVVAASDINKDAQNALLKTLEESGSAMFFFVVPSPGTLLPTFRSRLQPLALADVFKPAEGRIPDALISDFLKAAPRERLELLKPLLEKNEEEKRELGAILSFLSALESALAENPAALRPVYRARKYIADRGALAKPLLEQIALLVPTKS